MKPVIFAGLTALLMFAAMHSAYSLGIGGEGRVFGRMGSLAQKAKAPPPVGCASPTAPDGNIDLSQCSNAIYLASSLL